MSVERAIEYIDIDQALNPKKDKEKSDQNT